ncbi:MAG: phosphotransferase [Parasphingorhabdus sp.]
MIEVLSIEDSRDDRAFIEEVLRDVDPTARLTFKYDAESAIQELESGFFDLMILDLRIPYSSENPLETDPDHGVSVLGEARKLAPGLPILIFTGSEYESLVRTLMREGDRQDVWGCGRKKPTLDLVRKDSKSEFAKEVKEIVTDIQALSDCDHRNRADINLPIDADRLIRIAVRRLEGASYEVHKLGAGKSSADVFSVRVKDSSGKQIFNLVLKIDDHAKVEGEERKYRLHAQQLNSGHTPRLLERLEYGGHSRAAIIYDLVSDAEGSLFDIAGDAGKSITALSNLAEALTPWHLIDVETAMEIREIRRTNLSDERAAEVIGTFGLEWAESLEKRYIGTKRGVTHGDLHGGNVLVDGEDRTALIDFNDIERRPAVFDWISLELSLLFNIDGPARGGEWPTIEQCRNWAHIDAFVEQSPFEDFVRNCREHAMRVCTGERELCAVAYAYLLRQFRYVDTNKDRLKALIEGVHEGLQVL